MINVLKELFIWIYCLDILDAFLVFLAATAALLCLHRLFSRKAWWKWVLGLFLVGWAMVVVTTTTFARGDTQQCICNLMPFHSYMEVMNGGNREILRSNIMNIGLFYPAGLIGALLLSNKRPAWMRSVFVVVTLAIMSIGIEWLQYHFALGRCEVDDVIHNTVGALLGSLIPIYIMNYPIKKITNYPGI